MKSPFDESSTFANMLQSQINAADDYVAEFATLGLPSRQIVIMRVSAGYVSSMGFHHRMLSHGWFPS